MSEILFCDFETRSAVDIKKAGADVYARDPSTDILCLGYAFDDEAPRIWADGQSSPDRVFEHIAAGGKLVAHNASFELLIWNEVGQKLYDFPELKPEQVICTMCLCYAMALPGALADAAPALGLTLQKDSVGHRVMQFLSQPERIDDDGEIHWHEWYDYPDKFEQLFKYCLTDVEVERAIYGRVMKMSRSENEIWILDQKINRRGIKVDLKAVRAAIRIVEVEKARLDQEMRAVTEGAVPTANATGALSHWLKSLGLSVSGVSKADVLKLLAHKDLPDLARQALLIRQEAAKSSTAKLRAMAEGACHDGRLRGMFQYHGAGSTGRFAGRRVQLQNLPRPKLAQSEIDEIFEMLGQVKL